MHASSELRKLGSFKSLPKKYYFSYLNVTQIGYRSGKLTNMLWLITKLAFYFYEKVKGLILHKTMLNPNIH